MSSDIESIQRLGRNKPTTPNDPISWDRFTSPSIDLTTRLHELATRKFDAIAADLNDISSDPQACERQARALATVTMALDQIKRAQSARAINAWIVDEDDPRACPRDQEHFRTALADALDRLQESKNIFLT